MTKSIASDEATTLLDAHEFAVHRLSSNYSEHAERRQIVTRNALLSYIADLEAHANLAIVDAGELERLREALSKIIEVGTTEIINRVGDAWRDDGWVSTIVEHESVEIARAALQQREKQG